MLKLTDYQIKTLQEIADMRGVLFGVPNERMVDEESIELLLDNAISSYSEYLQFMVAMRECERHNYGVE